MKSISLTVKVIIDRFMKENVFNYKLYVART